MDWFIPDASGNSLLGLALTDSKFELAYVILRAATMRLSNGGSNNSDALRSTLEEFDKRSRAEVPDFPGLLQGLVCQGNTGAVEFLLQRGAEVNPK